MHAWFELVDSILRPRRPDLARCLRAREAHVAARRVEVTRAGRAVAECERSIEALRTAVFAANDGFVGARMTELERTWRRLSRVDPDLGLMDLWAHIAPAAWIDQKRWRGSAREAQLDAAVLLAADVLGVIAAESAIRSLGVALAAWDAPLCTRVRWRLPDADTPEPPDLTASLLARPLLAANEIIASSDLPAMATARALRLQDDVREAARSRFAHRPELTQSIAHAAFVDYLLGAARLGERLNPVTALFALWTTGYAIAAVDASGVTLEIPPLPSSPP